MAGWYEIKGVTFLDWAQSKKFPGIEVAVRQFKREINGLETVDIYTKMKNRRALSEMAKYFRREFDYDFRQFTEIPCASENFYNTVGYIFKSNHFSNSGDPFAAGGCCFRLRTPKTGKSYWALQWIWIHPFARNRGLLTKFWPEFKRVFGDFKIEHPLSHAMVGFLKKQNNDTLPKVENAEVN